MAIWAQLPSDLVRAVLSQPGVACDVKVDIGKKLGCSLACRLQVPEGLKEKLDRIMAARVPEVQLMGLRTQLYNIASADSKIRLEVYIMDSRALGYKVLVKKKKVVMQCIVSQSGASYDDWWVFSRREMLPNA